MAKAVKPLSGRSKKCEVCPNRFVPTRTFQTWCSPECAVKVARINQQKSRQIEIKARREGLKTKRDWTREAQIEFNRFIRERDHDLPCICCGKFGDGEEWLTGGKWDAGHMMSVGAHPELRFVEDNCHKQLKSCNAGSSKYAKKGRVVSEGYEERLIEKIGQARVEWLKGPHEPRHYTIDELKEIKKRYAKMARDLKKQRESN